MKDIRLTKVCGNKKKSVILIVQTKGFKANTKAPFGSQLYTL